MTDFFDEQREQSEIKATIVRKYFDAWTKIMKKKAKSDRLGYIDLFSGPGCYNDGTKSTPIKILKRIIDDDILRKRMITIFNDINIDYVNCLKSEIKNLEGINKLENEPIIKNDEVGLELAKEFEKPLIPCISFIDPWGYKGLSCRLVEALIKDWGCDCIFFFNYNRINMGITNPKVIKHINSIFGEKKADKLRKEVKYLKPFKREQKIVNELAEKLSNNRENFILPFQFVKENKDTTSHYLIFVSKSRVGYKIMKEIMAKISSKKQDGVASFSYIPVEDSQLKLLFSYSKPLDKLGEELLEVFSGRALKVKQIYNKHNIGTSFIKSNYKEALRRLEEKGKIKCDPPFEDRRMYKEKKSMADSVVVKFP